uniref:hypothetical protein n=1 Tax=Clostridium sp. NkU-1 TaxID=1095009 RepID=UPI000B00AB9F
MKRAIGIIMAAGMAAMALTGCGSSSQAQATAVQTTAAGGETTVGETSAPAENKEAQVITFWYNNTGMKRLSMRKRSVSTTLPRAIIRWKG